MPTFIGLDLAWTTRNESGICWLQGDSRDNLRCTRLEAAARDTEDLAEEVAAATPAVVTIDAPVLYTSSRWVEPEIARRFGRYKAAAHSSHAAVKQGRKAGILLGKALQRRGFMLNPIPLLAGTSPDRCAVEVYPHVIHVLLFGLSERLPYKPRGSKRPVEFRQEVFQEYQRHLRALIEREVPRVLECPDIQVALDPESVKRCETHASLKRLDDTLDGLTCALAAWLMWDRPEEWEMIGDLNGYIVAPKPQPG